MEFISLTLYAIVIVVSLAFYYIRSRHEYWKVRGIAYEEPHFLFGIWKGVRRTVGLYELFPNVYRRHKGSGPFVGFFMFTSPAVVLLDLDLVKNVLIKDFSLFEDRGIYYNERDDPLTAHLFALDGPKWRALRGKLTPTFTSGKMKLMYPIMVSVGEQLVQALDSETRANPDIEVREILARFTTDVIGTCAFGLNCNSLKDPNSEFRAMGKRVFSQSMPSWYLLFTELFPKTARFLRLKRVPEDISTFFTRIVEDTVRYRETNNIRRNDFMDLLIDLKNKKSIRSENGEELTALTMTEIVAQSFVFFAAGFETSSTTMGFTLYELALNQDIQDKLRKEVDEVIARHNGEMTYEATKEMQYLDQVINESLRMYSPASHLVRKAKAPYPTSDPRYVIPKGAFAIIPVFGIQHDPEFYPSPHVFDPERFSPEEVQKRHPMTWLPFGDGPRNCIGLRFGRMQASIGLAMLIRHFRFSQTTDTPIPMTFDKRSLVLASVKGIVLRVERI